MNIVDRGINKAKAAALTSDCPNFKVGAALLRNMLLAY